MFFVNDKKNSVMIHSTYKDNKFLDANYIETLENLKNEDPTYFQIYSKGEWGILKNIIYNNYIVDKEWPNDKMLKDISYGLDFGFNAKSSLVKVGFNKEFYVEEKLYQSGLTNNDLIDKLKNLIPKDVRRTRIIYCDSAEPARIEEICRAGFIAKPSDKSVKDGIDYCKRSKLHILYSSTNVIKEISGYKYKEDKDGNVLEIPLSWNDHSMDAMRYCIYTNWGKIKPKASLAFI